MKRLFFFCLFTLLGIGVVWGEEDLEIYPPLEEMGYEGRLSYGLWIAHPYLLFETTYSNNWNEGAYTDLATGRVYHKKLKDGAFTVIPGASFGYGHETFPIVFGYRGEFVRFLRYNEYDTEMHVGFFGGKILREYWRLTYRALFQRFIVSAPNDVGQTTDVIESDAVASEVVFELDLPPYRPFVGESQLLFRLRTYDNLREGLGTHSIALEGGWQGRVRQYWEILLWIGGEKRRYETRPANQIAAGALPYANFFGLVGELKVSWEVHPRAKVLAQIKGYLQDDTFADSGHKYVQHFGLTLEWQITPFWKLTTGPFLIVERFGRANQRDLNYPLRKRTDLRYNYRGKLIWTPYPWMRFTLEYTFTFLDSNMEVFDSEIHLLQWYAELGF